MKSPDLDKARSEQKLSLKDFLAAYNTNLPDSFPRASIINLNAFKDAYPSLFKGVDVWTLDIHRKRFMDWLPQHLKSLEA